MPLKKKSSISHPQNVNLLFGIVTDLKDYKLAFLLNNILNIEMERKEYEYSEETYQEKVIFYFSADMNFGYYLFKNIFKPDFFTRKFKNINFFLLAKPHLPVQKDTGIINQLTKHEKIVACLQIPDEKTILEAIKLLRITD